MRKARAFNLDDSAQQGPRRARRCASYGDLLANGTGTRHTGEQPAMNARAGLVAIFVLGATLSGCVKAPAKHGAVPAAQTASDRSGTPLATDYSTQSRADAQPIDDADHAICVSRSRFPDGHSSHSWFAHRVRLKDVVDEWYYGDSYYGWEDDSCVWIVGALGDELTADDVLPPPPFPSYATADASGYQSPSVAGAYYVWDQRTGALLAEGVLRERASAAVWDSYERLVSIGE